MKINVGLPLVAYALPDVWENIWPRAAATAQIAVAAASSAAIALPEQAPLEHDAGFGATLRARGAHDLQVSAIDGQQPEPQHAVLHT